MNKIILLIFIQILLLALAITIFSSVVWADSPLTSIDFYVAYQDEPIIELASKSKGILTRKLSEYLADSKNPVDIKMAVINRVGWNINGNRNAKIYLTFLSKKYGAGERNFLQKATADDLLSMAYLKALDNYSQLKTSLSYAEKALSMNPQSRTFNLVHALIEAQIEMDNTSKWCEVFQITDRVRKNTELNNDIREGAVKNIYEYMDSYQESCSSNPPPAEEEEDLPPPTVYEFKLSGKWRDSTNLSDFVNPDGKYVGDTTIGLGQTRELFGDTTYTNNLRNINSERILERHNVGTFQADAKYLTFRNKSSRLRVWDVKTHKLTYHSKSTLPPRKYRYLLENGEKDGEKVLSLWSTGDDEANYPNSPTKKFWLRKN